MKRLAWQTLLNSIAFYVASLLASSIQVNSLWDAVAAGAVLALVNVVIRPVVIIVTFPFNLLTLGLLTMVINAWMIMLTDRLIGGLSIPGLWLSMSVAVLMILVNYAFKRVKLFPKNNVIIR